MVGGTSGKANHRWVSSSVSFHLAPAIGLLTGKGLHQSCQTVCSVCSRNLSFPPPKLQDSVCAAASLLHGSNSNAHIGRTSSILIKPSSQCQTKHFLIHKSILLALIVLLQQKIHIFFQIESSSLSRLFFFSGWQIAHHVLYMTPNFCVVRTWNIIGRMKEKFTNYIKQQVINDIVIGLRVVKQTDNEIKI